MRESPALVVAKALRQKGYALKLYDPHIHEQMPDKVDSAEEALSGSDLMVVLTDHSQFAELDYSRLHGLMRHHTILDTRHVLNRESIEKAGFTYLEIGSTLPLKAHV